MWRMKLSKWAVLLFSFLFFVLKFNPFDKYYKIYSGFMISLQLFKKAKPRTPFVHISNFLIVISISIMSKSRVIGSDLYEEDGSEIRRGPWTLEEDNLLIEYVACHGEGRWNSLAKCAGLKRTGKSCRLRWLNYLKPDIKRGNLTPHEQLLILELHSEWGNRWSKIAQHLPGRTDNEIKNYWRTRVQKQARQLKVDSNSKKFVEAIRKFWKPRLLEKMKQESSDQTASPSSSISSLETQVFTATTPSPVLDQALMQQKPNNLVNISEHGNFTEDPRTAGIQVAGGAYSEFYDDCYFVDLPSYGMMPWMDSRDISFSECHAEGVDWFGDELGKDYFLGNR